MLAINMLFLKVMVARPCTVSTVETPLTGQDLDATHMNVHNFTYSTSSQAQIWLEFWRTQGRIQKACLGRGVGCGHGVPREYFSVYYYKNCVLLKAGCATLKNESVQQVSKIQIIGLHHFMQNCSRSIENYCFKH